MDFYAFLLKRIGFILKVKLHITTIAYAFVATPFQHNIYYFTHTHHLHCLLFTLSYIGTLNHTFFGVNETEEIDTYFFRIRAYDDVNNMAAWSNEISASFVNPADYERSVSIAA